MKPQQESSFEEEKQGGFASNWYSYQPLKVDGSWGKALGAVGDALGTTAADFLDPDPVTNPITRTVFSTASSAGAEQLGTVIDNSSAISNNVHTFIQEVTDSRSWEDAIGVWSQTLEFQDQ